MATSFGPLASYAADPQSRIHLTYRTSISRSSKIQAASGTSKEADLAEFDLLQRCTLHVFKGRAVADGTVPAQHNGKGDHRSRCY